MLLEKIVILGKLKILSKHHTSYDVLSDHLTDKGSLITSDLLSDNEQSMYVDKDDLELAMIRFKSLMIPPINRDEIESRIDEFKD